MHEKLTEYLNSVLICSLPVSVNNKKGKRKITSQLTGLDELPLIISGSLKTKKARMPISQIKMNALNIIAKAIKIYAPFQMFNL